MNAPSPTGLEVVAWEYRFGDTRPWHRTENPKTAEEERQDGSEVRPYAVTAASAQAMIAELGETVAAERRQTAELRKRNADMKARATAAEARADRLAGALREAESALRAIRAWARDAEDTNRASWAIGCIAAALQPEKARREG